MIKIVLLLCVFAFVAQGVPTVRYDGEPVIRVNISTEVQLNGLQNMLEHSFSRPVPAFNVWSRDSVLALGQNDIHIHKPVRETLREFKRLGLNYELFIPNVQELIDDPNSYTSNKTAPGVAADFFDAYHRYDEVTAYYMGLCAEYPAICKYDGDIARSVENRKIVALHIYGGTVKNPPKIWINGGQHAREWIGITTVAYITTQLLKNSKASPLEEYLKQVEIVIVPVVNPDGYEYSWSNDRMWRKNRKNNGGGIYGVDLNRNWNDHWGGIGSSNNPRDETYRGTGPFSEPESKGVSTYWQKVTESSKIISAIDYHSYSQLVLRPYGWTSNNPPNVAFLRTLGDDLVRQLRILYNTVYVNQGSYELYYTTGGASDWFESEGKAPLSYTIELRDTGRYGFLLPAVQIVPTGAENWAAFLVFIEQTLKFRSQN